MTKIVQKGSEMKKEYRNSARTKKMIRAAFAELIGEKKMISSISVAELAERADIAKSTFYNHYDDIYAVADELYRELVDSLNRVIDEMVADSTNDYRVYLEKLFDFLKENEDIYRRVSTSPDAFLFIQQIKHLVLKRVFSQARFLGAAKSREEEYVQMHFLTNACVDIMVNYYRGDLNISFDELKMSVIRLLDKILA